MARLRHRKARLVRKVRCPNYTGFLLTCQIPPQSLNPQGLQPHFQNRSYPLIINTRKTPQKSPFLPPFQMPFLIFHPQPIRDDFSVMHASAFLIRETKSGRRFARFFPLRIFMGACNQGRKVLEFLLWCRHCRHSFGFSRNNMKGALYHWRN